MNYSNREKAEPKYEAESRTLWKKEYNARGTINNRNIKKEAKGANFKFKTSNAEQQTNDMWYLIPET